MEDNRTSMPHSLFNEKVYRWTKSLKPGEWHPIVKIQPKTMTQEDFIDCIKYLICIGEPLEFSNDYTAFRRMPDYDWDYVFKPKEDEKVDNRDNGG